VSARLVTRWRSERAQLTNRDGRSGCSRASERCAELFQAERAAIRARSGERSKIGLQLRGAFPEASLESRCRHVERGKYTIEHVLPRAWQKHWPVESQDPVARDKRNHLLHTIGNLTLVTKRLNPRMSNGPWSEKRTALTAHSVLRLNQISSRPLAGLLKRGIT